jgi:MFS family permease
MRRSPEEHGLRPDGDAPVASGGGDGRRAGAAEVSLTAREATRTRAFWLLIVSTNLAGFALFGVNLHLFSCIADKGVATGAAAAIVTYLYVLHTVAKPVWGIVAERVHVRYCLAGCYVGGALGVLLLAQATSVAGLLVFATVYGLTRGAQSFVTSLAWSDYFGRGSQGAIRGLAAPFRAVASAGGPVAGGFLYDLSGSYGLALNVFAALFALGGLVSLAARPPRATPTIVTAA